MAAPLPAKFAPLSEGEEIAVLHALQVHDDYPSGSTPRQINKMLTRMSLAYPNAKLSVEEAGARMELYEDMLADLDVDILAAGFREAVKTCKFFPSVSEIRELAMAQPATPRMVQRSRLRTLLMTSRMESAPPREPNVTPEQIAAIKQEFGLSAEASAMIDRLVGKQAA